MDIFALGGLYVTWDSPIPLRADGMAAPFRRGSLPDGAERVVFQNHVASLADILSCPKLTVNPLGAVYNTPGGRVLVSHMGDMNHSMAAWLDSMAPVGTPGAPGGECRSCFSPDLARLVMAEDSLRGRMTADIVLGRAGLHRAMLLRGRPVIHAAYVDIGGEALLFTAPSGTGKSTQADLWRRFAGAEIINGDRVLLQWGAETDAGRLYACGYPVCGSSAICLDRTLPVRAIVLLSQGMENRVTRPGGAEAVRALLSATEVYRWDVNEIDTALALARRAAEAVPVLRLTCRPDREAVEVLREALEDECPPVAQAKHPDHF